MAVAPDGTIYVSDRGHETRGRYIWRIRPDGIAELVAGTGKRGHPSDGDVAATSPLGSPEGLTVLNDGTLLIADSHNHEVIRITHEGVIEIVAGRGNAGDSGAEGPATAASLNFPYDVAVDGSGNMFIADFGNHRIMHIDTDGIIHQVAGTGAPGYAGDGGPASQAQLYGPYGVAIDTEQRLLIADSLNHVIRRVEHDGTIVTIAGTGTPGYSGDGGLATNARFDTPQAMVAMPDGAIYVGDEHNDAIRVIHTDGTVATVLGDGVGGSAAIGTKLESVRLHDPEMFAFHDGTVLVAESVNQRVIRIDNGLVELVAGAQQ
jgi:sugar lactone lactonase YvrE